MALVKLLVAIAVTTAIAIAIITTATAVDHDKNVQETKTLLAPETNTEPRRFLSQTEKPTRNPNAADHCHKNPEICSSYGGNATAACCNNKCVDLSYDDKNCGACKNRCKFSQTCCRGQCVYLAYDKRHCGQCTRRCPAGDFCVYGLCNYA
ncbi:PREDICTED: stigma-specific STIG1-like protein 1 [Tarenaya hassleriana]|uniref:stigma-specific STIG1-like protein 1 n=1 Tax=Tarenaya hassleriana TaxID=28532 RepID=UPI00053C80BD|nr:PREDICTED: stigma-specific STIG1-like protein 1 [Tarenaya hassleriana]